MPNIIGKKLLESRLLLCIIIINALSFVYFLLIASPVYISNASLIVRSGDSRGSNMTSVLSGATGDGSEFGGYVFDDFAKSWNEFSRVRDPLKLRDEFSRGDFVTRFGGLESLLQTNDIALWKYYQSSVVINVETKSGIVTLAVKGYSPRLAHRLAQHLLNDAVTHLTAMNKDRERQMLRFSQMRVTELATQLEQQEAALAGYRSRIGVYEPAALYQSQLNLLNVLAARQTELDGQYNSLVREAPNSPVVSDLRSAVAHTRERVAQEQKLISKTSQQAAAFDGLRVRRDNTVALLGQATQALQQAERETVNNGYYLNVISEPSQPAVPEEPHRLRWILGIFLVSLLIWAILR